MKKTTITLGEDTKKQLEKFGKKGESFDIIMQRVMKNAETLCRKDTDENDDVEEASE